MGKSTKKDLPPVRSPEAKESQLINLAFKLAEAKLKDGTASSQLITHFLKLATVREQLENDKLRSDLKVANAKIKHMEAQETSKDLYERALAAFRLYAGSESQEEDDYDDE